jgi:CHASE1-domain containing sensor protein
MRARSLVALVFGLCLTGATCYLVHADQRSHTEDNFQRDAEKVARDTEVRLQTYFDMLLSVKGMYALEGRIDRVRFHRFIAELRLERRYPGFQALQFVRAVPAAELDAFTTAVRADTGIEPAGYPNFRIHPVTHAPIHYVIEYTEPLKGNENAFGLDLAALPPHLRSVELGRNTGEIIATEPILLVQDASGEPGFVTRAPVYRLGAPVATAAQRTDALVGFVAIVFRVNALMREVIDGALLEHLHVRIEDGGYVTGAMAPRTGNDNLLYDSAGKAGAPAGTGTGGTATAALVSEKILEVGQRRWLLRFEGRPGSRYGDGSGWLLTVAIGIAGVIISALTAALLEARRRPLQA